MPWLKQFRKRLDPLMWAELYREYKQWKQCQPLSTGDIESFENSQPTEEELQMLKALEEAETVLTEEILEKEKKKQKDTECEAACEAWAFSGVNYNEDGGNKLPNTPEGRGQISYWVSPDLFAPSPETIPDTPQKTLKRTFSQYFPPSQSSLSSKDVFEGELATQPARRLKFDNTIEFVNDVNVCENNGINYIIISDDEEDRPSSSSILEAN